MKTRHQIFYCNSNKMEEIEDNSVSLVVSSPPYPLIPMWDEIFKEQNPEIKDALETNQGSLAFELMHKELDLVWNEVYRVLSDGGIACINIGDATRKIGDDFQLYSNHSRALNHFLGIGFQVLPCIIWRKPTNAPNKFMGSGMLPPGAYVTLEHEYILILRKDGMRKFNSISEKENRRISAFFWEERNTWFSDVWTGLRGISQKIKDDNSELRERSAAYPFDLAFRLINMFSVKGDIVLDPFLGTGTTTLAAMASGRNSVGIEIDSNFRDIIITRVNELPILSKRLIKQRIGSHLSFINKRTKENKELKHMNEFYKFPVTTKQETKLVFSEVVSCQKITDNQFEVTYKDAINLS